jgi:MYXO-CTERM domain-containing protein
MRLLAHIPAAFVALTFAETAAADEPPVLEFPVDPDEVYGGEETAVCGWPTTVSMEGMCTGTLVHPQVVILAAHCGAGYDSVQFGENGESPTRSVPVEFCRSFPNGMQQPGTDFGFCKLKEPQMDIPIVPILMGCEVDEYLKSGQEVTIVGFGFSDGGGYGIKREVVTTINNIQDNEAFIGGGGKDSCNGDSGGPVYVKLKDGSWRVFGITSYGGQCGTGGYYSLMHNGIEWFEQESGIDLTPCHDAQGKWLGNGCAGFPLEPGAPGGAWDKGCGGGPVSGPSMSCGDVVPDTTPPICTVISPADDTVMYAPDMIANVVTEISVDASDEGWGVKQVDLKINGNAVPGGTNFIGNPYVWTGVEFPTGCYEIGASVLDHAGFTAECEPHTLCINMEVPPPPPPPPTTDSDSDSDTGGATSGEDPTGGEPTTDGGGTGVTSAGSGGTGPATGGADEDKAGCECDASGGPRGGALLLLGLAVLGRRRRR